MCGCNKNKGVTRAKPYTKSNVNIRPQQVTALNTNTTSLRASIKPQATGLSGKRRAEEKQRREILLRKLGRL